MEQQLMTLRTYSAALGAFCVAVLAVGSAGVDTAHAQARATAPIPPPPPAFPNQTRAPQPTQPSQFAIETLASGLQHPWALQFLPDGRFLISERPGYLRIVDRKGWMSSPIAGLPAVRVSAAEGLHDVVLDPDFARNRTIYFTYFAPPDGQPGGAYPGADFQK